jgi:putative transcriptional regulator
MEPCLLISSPQMKDPFFTGAVILLCQHDEKGALGLVINRETSLSVQNVLEQLSITLPGGFEEHAVNWGGPVEPGAGFIVFPGQVPEDEGWNPGRGIAVSPSRDQLVRALVQEQPFLLCLGYAGWGPGQLDDEIATGSWLVTDVDIDVVLTADMDERYDRALAKLGLQAMGVWMQPVDE